ncbi:MAG: ABC transporter ATP-binding protein [Cellulosilyticum sp.]|nr:ABC transporter ATP-binding protein [Cellulosilyticum sp.]
MKNIRNIAIRKGHWLILQLISSYFYASIIVKGNNLISGAIDQMLSGITGGVMTREFIVNLIGCVVLGFIASLIRDLSSLQFSIGIQKEFREKAGRKLLKLEFKYFDEHGSGSILNKMMNDLKIAGDFLSEFFPSIVNIILESAILIGSIFTMDIALVISLFICYPIILILSHIASKRISTLAEKRWANVDRMNDIAYDFMSGIIIGRTFNLLPTMDEKIVDANDKILNYEFKRNRLLRLAWILNHLVRFLPHVVLGTFALIRVIDGSLTVGGMTYFILILGNIIHPLGELPGLFNEARYCMVSIKRLEEIMNGPDELSGSWARTDSLDKQKRKEKATETVICFKDLSFGYEADAPVLKKQSFEIKQGEQVAFVGGSGEGKSTIFKLLCGFYHKNEGSYELYNRPFEEWDIDEARSLFSLVSQNVFLFPETITKNIGYGKDNATMEEIIQAAKNANIHDFIMTLPEGYETVVGERGERLSGGQRQRISIARAFLKDAPILLLDEPTSAIDVGTEELIKEAIYKISKGRTVLTIAHRLSTIEDADCIMVLSKGEIAERGTNTELLDMGGVYARLYEKQNQLQEEEVI